ncbi:MAG: alpha-mannosidase [Candidatus Aminicenantales bacterium]
MKTSKIALFLWVFILSLALLASGQNALQKRIQEIEHLIDSSVSSWKLLSKDRSGAEKAAVDDASWSSIRVRTPIREKVFWLRHMFEVPKAFSGVRTEGSAISLSCVFRGLGVIEAQFFQNGELRESFRLEFGNQTAQIRKSFALTLKAKPGERILLAFRFDNLGRLPLVERKNVEPGTFLQLWDVRFQIKKAQQAHQWLSRFLLDLKIGASLLDMLAQRGQQHTDERPLSESYKNLIGSREFHALQQRFVKAAMNFDIDSLRQGKLSRVKSSLLGFYRAVKPVSRFSKNYVLSVVGNSHIDLAWLWRWRETVEVAKETFSTVLDNMEEYPGIVYAQSQAQAYKWMEEYYPRLFERIRKKVKEGRWEIVGGMWAEPDCNLIDGESFIRQILYGKRYFREKFGVDVRVGWNPDSFGYNWNMPQFFRKSGIDFFITQKISWNDTTIFPYFLFWWEGPDGSRVLTYFPPTGYVGRLEAERMAEGLKQFERNTGLRNALILYGLGDHGGGPNREMLDRLEDYDKQGIFPEVKHLRVSEYLEGLRKKNLESLPVWKDELYLEYHRGTYTTQAETKKFNRKSEVLLSNTEKLASLALLFGKKYKQDLIQSAWERVLMNQFHDILPGSSIAAVYRDAKESYLEAQRLLGSVLKESLLHLARRIDTERGRKGTPLLVFNPLSWMSNGVVKAKLPPGLDKDVFVLGEDNEKVSSQVLSSPEGKILCFIAKDVPALGYRVYTIKKGKKTPSAGSLKVGQTFLENRYFSIHLHPKTGNIISLFDKQAKKEVLSSEACGNEIQLFEDRPARWDAWNIGYTGRSWKLERADNIRIRQKGPVLASLRVEKSFLGLSKARRSPTPDFPSSFFSQEIILYEDIPRIDIHMEADWWEEHTLLKVAFPVDIRSSRATYEIPFAFVQRPTSRNTPWERARFEVPAMRWADLSEESYGVSLLNESKYGCDIKDSTIRLTLLRSPTWPDPMADRGKHRFSYALFPHQGDWKKADTVRRGYEFNFPLISSLVSPHSGELPPFFSFFKTSPSNIILATVKKTEDRQSLILRLYEAEGTPTQAQITIFRRPKKVYELDLMENRLHSLPPKENVITLEFGKLEIKTIELVF